MSAWSPTPRSTKNPSPLPHRRGAWKVAAFPALLALTTILSWFLFRGRSGDSEKELRARLPMPYEQERVVRWMAQQGIAYLKERLKSDDRLIRDAAILALGHRRGDREATRLLLALCDGQDLEDAGSAVIALAIQGEPEARQVVSRFASGEAPYLREGAVSAIAACRDESLYPLLDALAGDTDARVRSAAQNAIARLRGPASPSDTPAGEH